MAKVKKVKELTHKQYQFRRARKNAKLMRMPIPNATSDNRVIVPNMWYIVWEEYILKPSIFKYHFRGKYHAYHFAMKNLHEYKYNVILGKDLLKYGITKAYGTLRSLANIRKEEKNTVGFIYGFDKSLERQRRKTLRTMYRRNLRRNLVKLAKNDNRRKDS